LKIDETLKTALGSNGVTGADELELGLVGLKALYNFSGLDNGNLQVGTEAFGANELASKYLETKKFLVSNPSKGGSGHSGAKPVEQTNLQVKKALESNNLAQAIQLSRQNNS